MAAATGLTIVKRLSYRGDATEEYSNTYWFTGTAPTTTAAWKTFADEVIALEKSVYPSTVSVIRAYGYNDDTGHKPDDTGAVAPAVAVIDYTVAPLAVVPGECPTTGGVVQGGDSAVWARWKTSRVTSPGGKAIYLRKYFHPAIAATGTPDVVLAAQKSNLVFLAGKLSDGTLATGRKLTTAGVTDVITATGASTYTTVRTLKRRGKRT